MEAVISKPATTYAEILVPTIFHEPWWLDIATEGRWGVAEATENGRVVGRLPYFERKKMGMSILGLPPLTHFLGPAVGKPGSNSLRHLDITKELLRKLPPASAIYVKCQRDIGDVIGFQSSGFRSSVQFTHEIEPQAVDVLWKNLRDKARNAIRRSRERYHVCVGKDPAAFMQFYRRNIEVKGETNWMDTNICTGLIQACLERNRGRLYEARDERGEFAAAIFCAWDNVSSYYLMTTRDPKAHFGATSLLVWEAISDAAKSGLIFDFDSSSEGSARFAYNFTSNVVPRYVATRIAPPLRLYHDARSIFQKDKFFTLN